MPSSSSGFPSPDPKGQLMLFSLLTQGHFNESWSDSPSDYQTPAPAASTSEKEQELYYSSLSFHKPRTHNFQVRDTTEYSEIKIGK